MKTPKIVNNISLIVFFVLLSISVISASGIQSALVGLCNNLRGIIGVAMIFLVLLAALIYAIGQVMGAETRARATVWSTAMFTGAIMGAVIYIVMPVVLNALFTGQSGISVACG